MGREVLRHWQKAADRAARGRPGPQTAKGGQRAEGCQRAGDLRWAEGLAAPGVYAGPRGVNTRGLAYRPAAMAAPRLTDPLPIHPRGPLQSRLRPPRSRSITNRALVAAALADGPSRLEGASESDDTLAMAGGLEALGIEIVRAPTAWAVEGGSGQLVAAGQLDVRASGTTARFLTAVASLAEGPSILDGVPRMRARPILELVRALGALGAPVEILGEDGCPPVRIAGGGLQGGRATIDARRSSQFVSALLLAAPCAKSDVELILADGELVSRPFVELTIDVMRAFGAEVEWRGDDTLTVAAKGYRARSYVIEPDAQSAVYPFCAAAIAGGEVRVEGIPEHSRQTDLRLLDVLETMGCSVERLPEAILVRRPPDHRLRGTEVNGNAFPDAILALAVVALFAEGPTTVTGLGHLPLKETDRLSALRTELCRLGAHADTGPDWLRVDPAPLHGASIETYDDHRMAMSFALAGLRVPGVEIRNPGCVAKTWPDFFSALEQW